VPDRDKPDGLAEAAILNDKLAQVLPREDGRRPEEIVL
jgi:hypothetical protein